MLHAPIVEILTSTTSYEDVQQHLPQLHSKNMAWFIEAKWHNILHRLHLSYFNPTPSALGSFSPIACFPKLMQHRESSSEDEGTYRSNSMNMPSSQLSSLKLHPLTAEIPKLAEMSINRTCTRPNHLMIPRLNLPTSHSPTPSSTPRSHT